MSVHAMEPECRNYDQRDSTMVNASQANRKGRNFATHGDSTMGKDHVTPWGTMATGEPSPASQPSNPTRQFNHLQNQEALAPQGCYAVPDSTPAHNHMQNAETEQNRDRTKMTQSRINDGNIALGEATAGDYSGTTAVLQSTAGTSQARLKVAPGSSRINDGNDIFGPADPAAQSSARRQSTAGGPEEPFQERPRTGHIRNPWMGYTDASRR